MYHEINDGKCKILKSKNIEKPWELYFWSSNYRDTCNLETVKDFLLEQESVLLKKYKGTTDGGTGLGPESTTSMYSIYNLFDEYPNSCLDKIKEFYIIEYNEFLKYLGIEVTNKKMTSWYNVLRYGQKIEEHFHGDLSRMSTNFVVDCYKSSTMYKLPYDCGNYEIANENGCLTIFNSLIPHWTTKNTVYKERVTMAADFYDDKNYSAELDHVITCF